MKCLLVADLHYDLRKFDWVMDIAEHVDLVVLAGDHLDLASSVDRPAQAVVVQRYFKRLRAKTRVLVSSGNHDLDSCTPSGEYQTRWVTKSRYFGIPNDGDSPLIEDCLFTICPWSQSRATEHAIAAQFRQHADQRPAHWFWIHHCPPEGSSTAFDGRRNHGDRALRHAIERHRPNFVLCGHVHQSPFVAKGAWIDRLGPTWIFNAGHQLGPVPSHIFIDTDALQAFWSSWDRIEQASLAQPRTPLSEPLQAPPAWLERCLARMHG